MAASLLALVGIASAALWPPPTASAAKCGGVVRDYLAQVKRAAPIRQVPEFEGLTSRQLPFAPRGISLLALATDVVVESSEVGFELSNDLGRRHLNWIVESELVEVSARGRDLRSLGIKRRGIGTFRAHVRIGFQHWVPAVPGYYRADIRFYRKGTHRLLGKYSSYTRVMKPRVDLRVRIDTPTVAPGEFARATLLNLGTVPLATRSYTFGFYVQAFTGEKWNFVPYNPPLRIPKRGGLWRLSPGRAERCRLRYLVPSDQPPGPFRFIARPGETKAETLIAEFQVASGP